MYDVIESDIKIEDMIYEIRGVQVMLDSDLARLYKVETKRINEAIKNNPKKFPDYYVFRISENEYKNLKSKVSTSKGGSRKGHTALTEQGIAMLATVLKTNTAEDISIKIMDAFVAMRHYLIENKDIYKSINNINNTLIDHTDKINYLFSNFDNYMPVFVGF